MMWEISIGRELLRENVVWKRSKWDEKVGGKVGQIGRNRVVNEWGERVKWEGDLRGGRMW